MDPAKLIKASIEKQKEPVDLVIMGKQAVDDDAGQTGQMLAGLLGWSQATFANKVEVDEANGVALATWEIDGGFQGVRCKLPLVVTTDLRLNRWSGTGRWLLVLWVRSVFQGIGTLRVALRFCCFCSIVGDVDGLVSRDKARFACGWRGGSPR